MRAILDTIDGALAEGRTVYFHCWGGIGRTGTVAGCWLVRHGMRGAEALAVVDGHMRTTGKGRQVPRSPETEAQCAYVRGWKE
jgi:protein-tyrosine phosphatase